MARKVIKKFMPKASAIREHRMLNRMGSWIYDPQLWHLNRHSAQKAFMIGLFCAFIPLPAQMIIAAFLALFLRANLPLSVGLVWITNPLTIPPIFYSCFKIGEFLLHTPDTEFVFELSWEWLQTDFKYIWQPLLLGSFLCGTFFGLLGYFGVGWFWRYHVLNRWHERRQRRLAKRNNHKPN